MCLDLGKSRTGVAACDSRRSLAYPVGVIQVGQKSEQSILALVEEYDPVAVIVGYPRNLAGDEGIAAHHIRRQARELACLLPVPVHLVDERMSSAEAHKKLRQAGKTTKNSRGIIDAQAAVGILESVLCALERGVDITEVLDQEEIHEGQQ